MKLKYLLPVLLCMLLPLCALADVTPNPVVSRKAPAYALGSQSSASAGNDMYYNTFWKGKAPEDWLAYDLSAVEEAHRAQVAVVWYSPSTFDQVGNYAYRSGAPTSYTIELNSAPGGECPTEGWEEAVRVEGSTLGSRVHVLDMTGYHWIRLRVTEVDGKADGTCQVNLDVHDISGGMSDSWLFLGDSITAGGMGNAYGTGYATYISRLRPAYFPVAINGGLGGLTSRDGKNHIDTWLADFPGQFVGIAYGTNDAWGNQMGTKRFRENMAYMIEAVLKSGKTPVVPTIPWAKEPGVGKHEGSYNQVIEELYAAYPEVIPGPDFYSLFEQHPEYLSTDGVHPNNTGYEEMRRVWAVEMAERVYGE